MKTLIFSVTGLLLVCSATVLACQQAGKHKGDVARTAAVVSPGKAVADIAVRHSLRGKASAGGALELELVFGKPGESELDVSINAPAALALAPVERRLAAGEPLRVTLVPQRDGRFYVNAAVRRADGAQRVVSIPVQVGALSRPVSKAQRSASGELLVRMRAD